MKRYLFVTGTFLLSLFLYIDRACISSAKENIGLDLGLTDTQLGWIFSAFSIGYALFQVPGGYFADKFGPRKVLTIIVTVWSLFTALTGAAWNYFSMLVFRFLFGAGEAGAFPGISRAVYSWIPLKERGTVQGINFSGSRFGAAVAFPLIALMIKGLGWRMSFVILGITGILFAFLWYILFKDKPEDHPGLSEQEKKFIMENRQEKTGEIKSVLSGRKMLSSSNVWLAMLQYFGSNFTFFFCLTWMLPHIRKTYELGLVEASFYASVPLIFGFFGNLSSGLLVDFIYKRNKWKLSRRIPPIIGFTLVIAGMLGSINMDTIEGAIAMLSIALFGADMTLSPSWTFCIDIGKENSGTVSGTMNMAGNIGAFITALAFPYLLNWTGSETLFFFVASGLAALSIVSWIFMNPEKALTE